MIQELDADGLSGVGGQVKGQLDPSTIVGGVLEELFQHRAITVSDSSFLPTIGAGVVAGGPVVEAQGSSFRGSRDSDQSIGR